MKQKLYALDAFFIEKLKLSENDPPANLVLDKSLSKILVRWPNVGPMYTGGLF